MEKLARKPSSDPVQEKLRQNKATWNKEVSIFINDLIHLKKTMNGWPSKFYQEKSTIKEPIPADPATIIGALAGDFQELAQKANAITEEQARYAQGRRKRQPKQLDLPLGQPQPQQPAEPAQPQPDLSQQLSLPNMSASNKDSELIKVAARFEDKYSLEKMASNPITRFFTRLFNPPVGVGKAADIRRARIAMLDSCADTFRNLNKFQVLVTKSSKDSIHEAKKKLDQCYNSWNLVARGYVIYKNSKALESLDKGGTIESQLNEEDLKEEKALEGLDSKDMKEVETQLSGKEKPFYNAYVNERTVREIVNDYKKYYAKIPDHDKNLPALVDLGHMVEDITFSKNYKNVPQTLVRTYIDTISILSGLYNVNGASLKDIVTQLSAQVSQPKKPTTAPVVQVPVPPPPPPVEDTITANLPTPIPPSEANAQNNQIEKVAQDFLKKWFGKTHHQFSLFDKTSTNRLHCYNMAKKIRTDLNNVMNLLEKGLNEDELDPAMKETNSKMIQLRGLMRTLHMSVPVEKKK